MTHKLAVERTLRRSAQRRSLPRWASFLVQTSHASIDGCGFDTMDLVRTGLLPGWLRHLGSARTCATLRFAGFAVSATVPACSFAASPTKAQPGAEREFGLTI